MEIISHVIKEEIVDRIKLTAKSKDSRIYNMIYFIVKDGSRQS